MATKCAIHNCFKPSVSKGLCDTHRKRVDRHGSPDQTRPPDWGSREKHPLYGVWNNLKRNYGFDVPQHWRDDFWAFVSEVPEKPTQACQAQRPDPSQPWAKDNFYWKESLISPEQRADRAAYMRAWSRMAREHNPEYHKNAYLRKKYGVTIAWYNATHAEQNGVCAICEREETAVIKGKRISLAVDHCHDTGKVRGLLCRSCNNAIGAFGHDPDLLFAAIAYLEK